MCWLTATSETFSYAPEHNKSKAIAICTGMAKTLGPVSLKLEDEVLVRVRSNTTVVDLLEQLDKACKGGRIQDAEGFDVTAHYSQDLPEGDYVIKQPVSGGPTDAAVLTDVAVSGVEHEE